MLFLFPKNRRFSGALGYKEEATPFLIKIRGNPDPKFNTLMSYTFSQYQKDTAITAVYPKIGESYIYPLLGLNDEVGEVTGKIKKVFRDETGIISPAKLNDLKKELGDVLWYLSQLSTELGLGLEEIAQGNIDKLKSRQERGVLQGSGDDR